MKGSSENSHSEGTDHAQNDFKITHLHFPLKIRFSSKAGVSHGVISMLRILLLK